MLASICAAYFASDAWAELRRARAGVESERREAAVVAEKTRGLEVGRGGGTLGSQIVLTAEAPPPRVVAALAALLPPDVRLDGVALAYGDNLGIEARVVARHAASYDLFLKRLSESPSFTGIVPGAESRQSGVQASVQMRYRGGAGR